MTGLELQILGGVLIFLGVVLGAVSQYMLSRWHKKVLSEI